MYIYIRSMSEAQSKIYDKVTAAASQIDMHIIKILSFPNSPYVDHWMHEIWAFLNLVGKLKGSNKFPKAVFIKRALSVYNDMLDSIIDIAQDDESGLIPIDVSLDEVKRCVTEYQSWLASELSAHGGVKQSDVKAKLKEICNI